MSDIITPIVSIIITIAIMIVITYIFNVSKRHNVKNELKIDNQREQLTPAKPTKVAIENKCKRFMEIVLIPLNGIPPVIYNFEFDLSASIADLKHDLLQSMKKHNYQIRCSLQGFLRETESYLIKKNNNIIPVEIINLCGAYFNAYYPMTTNLNIINFAIFMSSSATIEMNSRSTYQAITTDQCLFNGMPRPDTGIDILYFSQQYYHFMVYELMDDNILKKFINFDQFANKLKTTAILIHHHTLDNAAKKPLMIKLPIQYDIKAHILCDMIHYKIGKYVENKMLEEWRKRNNYNKDVMPYEIYIGNKQLEFIDYINILDLHGVMKVVDDQKQVEIIETEYAQQQVRERLGWRGRHNFKGITAQIRIQWNASDNLFKHDLFLNPHDTMDDLFADKYQEEEEQQDVLDKICSMFD